MLKKMILSAALAAAAVASIGTAEAYVVVHRRVVHPFVHRAVIVRHPIRRIVRHVL